jgi:hypothetical protein
MYTVDKSTKRWTLTSPKLTSLSALGSILKNFWEPMSVDVRVILLVEDNTMGKYLHPYIESGTLRVIHVCTLWTYQQEMDSHITKNLTSLSAFGSILKNFWEPMSVDVRVILLVEDNTMGKYLHPYIESRTLRVYMYVHYGYRLINKR